METVQMKVSFAKLLRIVIFLCTSSAVLAQTATTTLRGTIADPSGAFVPGATINLKDVASDLHSVRTTDSKGEYVFSPIEPGKYLITVSANRFRRSG
jgi:type 1 fimbria pilin